jgi:hypothetical protein
MTKLELLLVRAEFLYELIIRFKLNNCNTLVEDAENELEKVKQEYVNLKGQLQ